MNKADRAVYDKARNIWSAFRRCHEEQDIAASDYIYICYWSLINKRVDLDFFIKNIDEMEDYVGRFLEKAHDKMMDQPTEDP